MFAAAGCDLVVVARRAARLEALAAELGAHGDRVHVVALDLAQPGAVPRVVAETERLGLDVTYLVSNAGFATSGPFAQADPARELALLQVDVVTPLALARAFLPGMIERGRGRILNVSSTAGFQPGPFMASYYASKAFLNSFSEALSYEVRGTGVTVTVSCPGPMATEFAAVAGTERTRLWAGRRGRDPAVVAREAYEAMMAGRPLIVHGLASWAGVEALRLGPRAVVRAAAGRFNRPSRRAG